MTTGPWCDFPSDQKRSCRRKQLSGDWVQHIAVPVELVERRLSHGYLDLSKGIILRDGVMDDEVSSLARRTVDITTTLIKVGQAGAVIFIDVTFVCVDEDPTLMSSLDLHDFVFVLSETMYRSPGSPQANRCFACASSSLWADNSARCCASRANIINLKPGLFAKDISYILEGHVGTYVTAAINVIKNMMQVVIKYFYSCD